MNNVVHSTAEAVLRALRVCRNEAVLRLGIIRPPMRTLLTGQAHVQLHQEWEGGRSVDHGVCEVTVNSDRTLNITSADADGVALRHVFVLQKMIEMVECFGSGLREPRASRDSMSQSHRACRQSDVIPDSIYALVRLRWARGL